uniref:Ependymin-1-like n=1 Tax=Hippocampus comes TaxID=109280 RepID=A0A3Q2YN51_HIPCM
AKMYTAVLLFAFVCWTASAHADHHQPCRSPNMTGSLSVVSQMGGRAETKAVGLFTYDSMNKKLRFQSNSSLPLNVTLDLDLLVFFEEGILYKIDSKNQSCEKKALQSRKHPFALPSDATFMTTMTSGSAFIEGEGLKFQIWTTPTPGFKGRGLPFVCPALLLLLSLGPDPKIRSSNEYHIGLARCGGKCPSGHRNAIFFFFFCL